MGRVKSLLKKIDVEVAKGKRTCTNNGSAIRKGEVCLVVKDGIHDRHPYCRDVALKMIEVARDRLDEIELELTSHEHQTRFA